MLYNDFRPLTFDYVRGQEVPLTILRNQVRNKEFSHSFLFVGVHGTGKTTLAKIFARGINCEHPTEEGNPCNKCKSCLEHLNNNNIDIIEIDGASNNGVDSIRAIKEQINYLPTFKKKIYIIDEVHMLSNSAWNALLTTLEEPPSHVVFIFCTTEKHKIPNTILSRCMKLEFNKISNQNIYENLKYICESKKFTYTNEGLEYIVSAANGSVRDSLSHLEKIIQFSNGKIDSLIASKVLGIVDKVSIEKLFFHILNKDITSALEIVNDMYYNGKNLSKLVEEVIEIIRDAMVISFNPGANTKYSSKLLSSLSLPIEQCYKAINDGNLIINKTNKTQVDIWIINLLNTFNIKLKIKYDELFLEDNKELHEEKEEVENDTVISLKETKEKIESKLQETQKIVESKTYYGYLINKIDLIKSYDINDPNILILLNSNVYCKHNKFIIKTKFADKLDKNDIKSRLKKITNKDINLDIISA